MKNFTLKTLFIIALCITLFSSVAFAKSEKQDLIVVLGDSIPFGYNLDKNNNPSKDAYPTLVGNSEGYKVKNLAVTGDTSEDLLRLLQTKEYQKNIAVADVVILEIGSNDLLQGAKPIIEKINTIPNYQPTFEDIALLKKIGQNLTLNLGEIIVKIRTLTESPIILYNIYNPYYGADIMTAPLLGSINPIYNYYASLPNIELVNTYSAFYGKQDALIITGDIHPTYAGHQVLKELTINALNNLND